MKAKQLIVPNKKCRHAIQMTNDRPVYILPLINYNVYWPIIGHLNCMTSFLSGTISCIYESFPNAYLHNQILCRSFAHWIVWFLTEGYSVVTYDTQSFFPSETRMIKAMLSKQIVGQTNINTCIKKKKILIYINLL